jgi:DNA-binding transcriptional MerR regulator
MLRVVDVLVPIGEFSKMTYLSVKALRHYHDVGLLEPSQIDPATGYRFYSPAQVPTAQAIRRFRDLDMPLEQIRAVLAAPDRAARNDAIVAHLARMQQQLERTQLTVASLQALLGKSRMAGTVERRSVDALPVLAVSGTVAFDDSLGWLEVVFAELHATATAMKVDVTGADGALYYEDFFQDGTGTVTAFVPVTVARPTDVPAGRAVLTELPAAELAVMVHKGSFDELDQTYGALGTYVTEHGIGLPGPIREHYTADDRAEVCWPIDAVRADSRS